MATDNLKQRIRDDRRDNDSDSTAAEEEDKGGKRNNNKKKMEMAKRGLRSLSVAVGLPLSLTLLNIYFNGGGASDRYLKQEKPFWFPPLMVLHAACVASAFLMGLSSWLVWVEGGFHKKPTALYLCISQFGLSLAWYPIVLHLGADWAGLLICLAMLGALVACSRVFKEANPIACDLIKPCIAWAAVLSLVNLKLVFT